MVTRSWWLVVLVAACSQPRASQAPSIEGPRVRVLGIAQDGGLPHAACACERCNAARLDPTRASPVASLAVIDSESVWLIDASPDLPDQLQALADVRSQTPGAVDRHPIDGVLLTHAHIGHYLGLAFLGFEAIAATGVDVWASPTMVGFLREHAPWDQLVRHENIVLHEAIAGRPVELGAAIEAMPFDVPHRAEYTDTFGWRLTGPRASVLYIPDTDPWPKWSSRSGSRPEFTGKLDSLLKGVDLFMIDGTFYSADELPGRDIAEIGHPLIVDTMDLLQDRVSAGEIEVWFIHLNHSNPVLDPNSPERAELERRGFRVAAVGDEFGL